MKKGKSERYDICEFCSEFWEGVDKSATCETPCPCASYANQDYVYRRESLTIGLPPPKAFPGSLGESTCTFWSDLPEDKKKDLALLIGDLWKHIDNVSQRMLILLLEGADMEQICDEMHIDNATFYNYTHILRKEVKKELKNRKGTREST
jgi:hypothetical protein